MTAKKPSGFIIFIAIATLQLLSTPASADEPYGRTYANPLVMFALKNSNVRAGPGPKHQIVGLLKTGQKVQVTGKSGNWYALKPNRENRPRFVYAPLLTVAGSSKDTNTEGDLTTETFTYTNGDQYEGQTLNGTRHGQGVYTWINGSRYEGDFRDNKRTGRGVQNLGQREPLRRRLPERQAGRTRHLYMGIGHTPRRRVSQRKTARPRDPDVGQREPLRRRIPEQQADGTRHLHMGIRHTPRRRVSRREIPRPRDPHVGQRNTL